MHRDLLKRPGSSLLLALLAGLLSIPTLAAAQSEPGSTLQPGSDGNRPKGGASAPRVVGQEAALRLTLADAVRMAFENNLDIAVVDYDRDIARENIVAASGTFDPVLRFGTPGTTTITGASQGFFGGGGGGNGIGFSNSKQPASSQLAGADVVKNETWSTAFGFSHLLIGGFNYSLSYQVSRNVSNSAFTSLNPSWDNTVSLSFTQPLLRGRGEDSTAEQLLLARRNEAVTQEAFRAQVETILVQVESAYWELVFAERNLEVAEQSLQLAEEQLERTRAQVEVGLLAPVQETQAEVAVAERRSDLIIARNAAENAGDDLRAALRAETLPSGWQTPIEAVDEPAAGSLETDLQRDLQSALERRAEVLQARAQIEARRVETDASRNDQLPQLDLVGSLSYSGIGGDILIRDGFFGPIIETIDGGYSDAAGQAFSLEVPTWSLGFNFSMPLHNRTAQGSYARATLAEDKARAELARVEQQTELEVRRAIRAVEQVVELVSSTREARELAARQLEIEQDRFEVGMSTNFEVLEFQDDLAQARSVELRALIDQRLARAQYARVTGRLLEEFGIDLR